MEGKEYMLLSGRAQFLASSIDKVSLSLGQHLPAMPVHKGDQEMHVVVQQEDSQNMFSSKPCRIPGIQSASKNGEKPSGEEVAYLSIRNKQTSEKSPKRSKIDDETINKIEHNISRYKGNDNTNRDIITLPPNICTEVQENRPRRQSLDCSMGSSSEILECSQEIQKSLVEENIVEQQVQLICELCGELFSSNELLELHLSRYSKSDPALCEVSNISSVLYSFLSI